MQSFIDGSKNPSHQIDLFPLFYFVVYGACLRNFGAIFWRNLNKMRATPQTEKKSTNLSD